jgi:hypothetical protein
MNRLFLVFHQGDSGNRRDSAFRAIPSPFMGVCCPDAVLVEEYVGSQLLMFCCKATDLHKTFLVFLFVSEEELGWFLKKRSVKKVLYPGELAAPRHYNGGVWCMLHEAY